MKPIILIALLTLSNIVIGQAFENDWESFSIENWTAEVAEDTSFAPNIRGVHGVGRVTFKNSALNKSITYLIYNVGYVNDEFKDEFEHWYSIQSCLLSCSVTSFVKNNYYYTIQACDHCGFSYVLEGEEIETQEVDVCDGLMKELSQYKLE
jgi:glutaminase